MLVIIFNQVVVLGGSGISFFGLHGSENRAWSLHLVQNFLVFDTLSYSLVDCFDLFPLFSLDECSSLFKPVNDFRVVESKCDLSNLDVLLSWTIDSIVRELIESLLYLELNVQLELIDLSHWISWVIVVQFEFLLNCLLKVEFDSIISSCDCFNIKIYKFGLLKSLDVINVDNCV